MVRFDDIYKTLETYVSSIPDLPELVFENETYEPTRGNTFIEVSHSLDRPDAQCIGKHTDFKYTGFIKFFINVDTNKGKAETMGVVDKLVSAFEYNTYIENVYSGKPIYIREAPELNEGRHIDAWYRTPIYVYWEQEK